MKCNRIKQMSMTFGRSVGLVVFVAAGLLVAQDEHQERQKPRQEDQRQDQAKDQDRQKQEQDKNTQEQRQQVQVQDQKNQRQQQQDKNQQERGRQEQNRNQQEQKQQVQVQKNQQEQQRQVQEQRQQVEVRRQNDQRQQQDNNRQEQRQQVQVRQHDEGLQKQQSHRAVVTVRVGKSEQRNVWQQHRAGSWENEHRSWQDRGGYIGYRIPQVRFHGFFGIDHRFRIVNHSFEIYDGHPRFRYNGFWFSIVDPWPEYWSDTWYESDDVYIDYSGDGYYLYNRRHPGIGIAVNVYAN